MIGAFELSDKFKTLEEFGHNEEVANIKEMAPAVIAEYRAFKEVLSAVVASGPDEKEELPKEQIVELLQKMEKKHIDMVL